MGRRSRRRFRIAVVVVLATIFGSLLVWRLHDGNPPALAVTLPTATAPRPSASASPSPSSIAPDPTTSPTPGAPGFGGFPFPVPAGLGRYADGSHRVTLQATSNARTAVLEYYVPTSAKPVVVERNVAPPFAATLPAKGSGILSAIAVQAGPDGEKTTCRVYVDGVLRNERTVKGAFAVAVCYA